jgi:hypothetical protein
MAHLLGEVVIYSTSPLEESSTCIPPFKGEGDILVKRG